MRRIICEAYHKIKRWIIIKRLDLGFYRKEKVQGVADMCVLYQKCPFSDPGCVSNSFANADDDENIILSIIIPLYNSVPYIENLVNMLMNQKTSYPYEVLFINDGSTDETEQEVLDRILLLPNMKLLSQSNTGIGGARNLGLEHAVGKYIAFMDHDDEIEKNFIEKILNKALENDADIVKCHYGQKINGTIVSTQIASGFVWGGVYARKLFYKTRFPIGYWYEDMINPFLLRPQAELIENIDDVLYYSNYTGKNASKILWRDNDYRCLQQIYLCKSLVDGYRKLGFDDYEYLLRRILGELGKLGSSRMRNLDDMVKRQAFLVCCDIVSDIDSFTGHSNFSDVEDYVLSVFKNRDYNGWKLLGEI